MNFLQRLNLIVMVFGTIAISSNCLGLPKVSQKSNSKINDALALSEVNSSDNDIIIWGISHRLRETVDLMTKANFNILAIVDVRINNRKNIQNIFGIKVIKKEDIPKNIKIVSSFTEEEDYSQFLKCLEYSIKNGNRCLHPVFALFDIEFPNTTVTKIKQYGAPGAGNVLIGAFIQEHLPKQNKNDEEMYYAHIATGYYNLLKRETEKVVNGIYKLDNPFKIDAGIAVADLYNATFHFYSKNPEIRHAFAFTSIPCPIFAFTAYTASHEFPTKEAIDFYKKKKYKQILVLRHPLENILSILRKFREDIEEDVVINCYPDLLNVQLQFFSNFYRHVLENIDDLYVVKYEDILLNPIESLYKLANYLNLPVDEKGIKIWWNKNGYKNLVKVRGKNPHFMGGGNDKWKKAFPKRTFDIFMNSGIIQMSNILGYSASYNDFMPDSYVDKVIDPLQVLYYKKKIIFFNYSYWMKNECDALITPQGNKVYFYDTAETIKSYDFSGDITLLNLVDAMILRDK